MKWCISFQVAYFSDREHRLVKECDRLRGHLVQIEEGYTREALEAEDREKELRNRLASNEEKILSSSSTIENFRYFLLIKLYQLYIVSTEHVFCLYLPSGLILILFYCFISMINWISVRDVLLLYDYLLASAWIQPSRLKIFTFSCMH